MLDLVRYDLNGSSGLSNLVKQLILACPYPDAAAFSRRVKIQLSSLPALWLAWESCPEVHRCDRRSSTWKRECPRWPRLCCAWSARLSLARSERVGLVKLIHGYGSKGVGGRLREEVQSELMRLKRNGQIHGYIPGEDFRASNAESWALVQKHRPLRDDHDFNRGNRGITLVVL